MSWAIVALIIRIGHGVPSVEGRVREFGHSTAQSGEGRSIPTVSFDYCFIGDKGDVETQAEAEAEPGSIKVLVVRDNRSKAVFLIQFL